MTGFKLAVFEHKRPQCQRKQLNRFVGRAGIAGFRGWLCAAAEKSVLTKHANVSHSESAD